MLRCAMIGSESHGHDEKDGKPPHHHCLQSGERCYKLLVALALLLGSACTHKPDVVRPESVSVGAIFVRGSKTGWWQQCTPADHGVHCRIWNEAGLVLEDEVFLPYDGGQPPEAEELKISPEPTFPGPDRIFLTNGRILLPRSRFDELKIFVDWLEGKRNTPR
jgi:hypothetical protein